jgi:hypothetical protein
LIALATPTSGGVTHVVVHDAVEWFAEETADIPLAPADVPLLASIWVTQRSAIGTPRPASMR